MAKKSSLGRKDVFFINVDNQKLVNAIEAAGGNIKPALEKAAKKSIPIVEKEFKTFIGKHHETGDTESSLMKSSDVKFIWGKNAKKRFVGSTTKGKKGFTGGSVQVVSEDDCLFFEYGFDAGGKEKKGLPALFLDTGAKEHMMEKNGKRWKHPGIKGHFFIYYSVENNMSEIHKIQADELTKILKELM